MNPNIRYLGLRINDINLIFFADDKTITLHALAEGFYHQKELTDTLAMLKQHGFAGKKVLLEIGANIGTTTVAAAHINSFSKIYSFEPILENVQLIHAQLALNTLTTPVEVIAKAISNKKGPNKIWRSKINYGDNRLVIDNSAQKPPENTCETIECIDLDSFLVENQVDFSSLGLLWVDTQGLEALVLDGARQLLATKKVPWLIEFWPDEMRKNHTYDLFYLIVQEHFSFYIDTNKGIKTPINELMQLEKDLIYLSDFRNIILIP